MSAGPIERAITDLVVAFCLYAAAPGGQEAVLTVSAEWFTALENELQRTDRLRFRPARNPDAYELQVVLPGTLIRVRRADPP